MRAAIGTFVAPAIIGLAVMLGCGRAHAAEPPAIGSQGLVPRDRGFALEAGVALPVAQVPVVASRGFQANLLAGYKIGRVVVGLGVNLSGSASDGPGALLVKLSVAPGVRVALWQSPDGKLDLGGQADLGVGHTFGDAGDGWDATLGLPTGASLLTDDLFAFGDLGPVARYWVHPQLALVSTVLLRADWSRFRSGPFESTRLEVALSVGMGLLAVF